MVLAAAEKSKQFTSMDRISQIKEIERTKKEQYAYEAQKSATGLDSLEGVP